MNPLDFSGGTASNLLRTRPTRWPLPAKIILALAFALLPLGMLAFIAAIDTYQDLLTGQTELAHSELIALQRATEASFDEDFSMLQTALFDDVETPEQRVACDRLLTNIARFDLRIQSIARIDAAGRLLCASVGARLPGDDIVVALQQDSPDIPMRFIRMLMMDPASGDLMIVLRDNGARATGAALVARIPRKMFGAFIDSSILTPREAVQLRLRGRPLVTLGPMPAVGLLHDTPSSASVDPIVYPVTAADGSRWLASQVALSTPGLELILISPAGELSTPQALGIALPALMWLGALAIGWVAIHRLVVEPLIALRRSVERYTAGDDTVRLGPHDFSTAELQSLGVAFDSMADRIRRHESELHSALAVQKKLTREVHHRVKNNLQIVSSLLSLQSRDAPNAAAAHAYATIQQRVSALALVHRWLFDEEAMRGVDMRSLTQDLCAGLEHSIAGSEAAAVSIALDVERIYVGQDTAVPLAFLITEIVTAAARFGYGAPLTLRITARASDGYARLTIEAAPFRQRNLFETGLTDPSARIVQGMARQMRSTLDYDSTIGSYSIRFPIVPGRSVGTE